MKCANFPRHLKRLINRCLIAHPEGADTIQLAHWAYGEREGLQLLPSVSCFLPVDRRVGVAVPVLLFYLEAPRLLRNRSADRGLEALWEPKDTQQIRKAPACVHRG
jgi:hypothetical protein